MAAQKWVCVFSPPPRADGRVWRIQQRGRRSVSAAVPQKRLMILGQLSCGAFAE